MHKISVIVPIYKTGKLLRQTLNSIRNQSFVDFECLLVDDGSDHIETLLICEKFVSQDPRFKYFIKVNEGIEKTRLYGVRKSSSPLLIFCDHDDYYERNALQLLFDAWLSSRADIVIGNCYMQLSRKVPFREGNYLRIAEENVINHNEFVSKYFKNFFGINLFHVTTWGKLYSKYLFEKELQYFGYNFFEDIILNSQLFSGVSKVHFIPQYLYTHIYGGLSSRFDVKNVFNGYKDIYGFRNGLLRKAGLYDQLNRSLLVEFNNVVNQYVVLMIENGYRKSDFVDAMYIIHESEILKDTLHADFDKGIFFDYIANGRYDDLYDFLLSRKTFKKIVVSKAKKFVKSLIS